MIWAVTNLYVHTLYGVKALIFPHVPDPFLINKLYATPSSFY